MKQIKYTIAVPAYKAKFFECCLKSILSQTYCNFEIIIVNDNSPEDLHSIVSKFNDDRIIYYENEKNCGAIDVVDNWNKCLDYSTGDYIMCIGDDDMLLPNCLETYNQLISDYPGKFVYHGWTEMIDENNNVIRMQEPRPIEESVYSMIWQRWQGRSQYIGDFLFDTEMLRDNGGFYKLPLAWASDDITAYIAAEKHGIANTQIPVFLYRVNALTISNTGNSDIKILAKNEEIQWYKQFLLKNPVNADIVQQTFRSMCIKGLPLFDRLKTEEIVKRDIISHGNFRIFYWLSNKKRLKVSGKNILIAFLKAQNK